MQAFIRHNRSNAFDAGIAKWVVLRTEAADYGSVLKAEATIQERKLNNLSIILSYPDGRQIVVVPSL